MENQGKTQKQIEDTSEFIVIAFSGTVLLFPVKETRNRI